MRTHRIAFQLNSGRPIPDDMLVCHHCDNPPCCNPKHLFLGTNKDNVHDMIRKGRLNPAHGPAFSAIMKKRAARGKDNGLVKHPESILLGTEVWNSILTNNDVRKMRRMYASGWYFQKELAAMFGVSKQTANYVLNRKLWGHVK